nr:uncharacterized mitochondrial protein AtMg00810-like [Tanacetum cinerariifolium]
MSRVRMLRVRTFSRIVQLILFIFDSGCTKHMMGNLKLLCNFTEKYLDTVRFGNDQFAPILGYRDLVQGNITINGIYYVEGLNLFSDQLCSSCELSIAKRSSFKTKVVLSSKGRLNLLHMDLCGPMHVQSINGKKYILENNIDQAVDANIDENKFDNIFSTSDHPLSQIHGNPFKPVQTRRQLATDPEMCMFELTMSNAKPKNIKEAMADSIWIEAIQDELHQFDRLQVWELIDKQFGKKIIELYGLQIHQSPRGIFIDQAKYTLEILKEHGMEKYDSIRTLMATKPKMDADLSGTPVDQTRYHSMIGLLMYLTFSLTRYCASSMLLSTLSS